MLYDANPVLPDMAISKINDGLKTLVAKGRLDEKARNEIVSRIYSINKSNIEADLIIEAVVEDLSIKQKLFHDLERINSAQTILCSNTSSLSITQIFSKCENQTRCLGVHFFNPAQIMKLVELVAGKKTDMSILNSVGDFLKKLGKTTVVSKDSPGFIVNRVARHFYLESLKVLEEGTAKIEDIDSLLRSAGFKMGPFELMDLIGIDVNLAVSNAVFNGFNQNPKYMPNAIQIEKVRRGELGRKSGIGFYDYSSTK